MGLECELNETFLPLPELALGGRKREPGRVLLAELEGSLDGETLRGVVHPAPIRQIEIHELATGGKPL